jgi:outer membrane protein assembly factor BamB
MPRVNTAEIVLPILLAFLLPGPASVAQNGSTPELTVSRCWNNSEVSSGRFVAINSESLFVGTGDGEIAALSSAGRKLWESELGGRVNSNLLLSESSLLAVTSVAPGASGDSVDLLRSLSKTTGVTNWIAKLQPSARYALSEHAGQVIVAGTSGNLLAVDQKTGATKWSRAYGQLTADPVFARGRVLLAAGGGQLLTVSLDTGEVEATRKLPTSPTVIAETAVGQIVTGDDRGNVFLLNGTDKPVWKFKSGGAITRLFVVTDYVVAVSNDNFVYHLLLRNGDVDWKKRLSGRVAMAGVVNDDFVVTQSLDDPSIVFTDLVSGRTIGQIFVDPEEVLTGNIVYAGNLLYLVTNRGVRKVSVGDCA